MNIKSLKFSTVASVQLIARGAESQGKLDENPEITKLKSDIGMSKALVKDS